MKVRFFDPGKGYLKIKDEIDSEIQRVLSAGDLILRDDVEKFEKNLSNFVGSNFAVGVNSGTDALYLALKAVGVGVGDEVITNSHTFVATAQVIVQTGAKPILTDLDEDWKTYYTKKTKAVIPCHISGDVSSWEYPIDRNFFVIDDACQALGAIKNPTTDIQCWSFYPAKILGAYGDAGAITTNNEDIYLEVKELRNHFKKDYSEWGINSRLDNLQAAILNVKMKYLTEILSKRKEVANCYLLALNGIVGLPQNNSIRVWQDFIIRTEKRDQLYEFLKEKGIETMKNEYPFPIQKLPKSIQYEAETLRLPCNENLTDNEIYYVIDTIKKFYGL